MATELSDLLDKLRETHELDGRTNPTSREALHEALLIYIALAVERLDRQ